MEAKVAFWRKQAAKRFDDQRDRQERYYQKQADKLYQKTIKNLDNGFTSFRCREAFLEEALRRVQARLPQGVEIIQERHSNGTYDNDYAIINISFTD